MSWSNYDDALQQLQAAGLEVAHLDWHWVSGPYSTGPGCPDARRLAFVSGFAPPWRECRALPGQGDDAPRVVPESVPAQRERRSWRDWFRRRPTGGQ